MSVTDAADDAVLERIVAFLVDFVLLAVASAVLWLVFFVLRTVLAIGGTAAAGAGAEGGVMAGLSAVGIAVTLVMWLVIAGVLLGYYGLLSAEGRQTLGMRMIDVEVVDADGDGATTQQALTRSAVLFAPLPLMALADALLPLGFLLALVLMAGWLVVELAVMVVSDGKQRLGDRLADTYVIEDEVSVQAAATT